MNQLSLIKENIEIKMPVLVKTDYLMPNPWNPNKVAKPEMDLLRISIRNSGFCYPIVVVKKCDKEYVIVDGFHRHLLAIEFNMEYVPAVILDDPIEELMAVTIRFNRARGTHHIDRMSNIVTQLIKLNLTTDEIKKNLGMDADEVLRLKQHSGIAEIFKDYEYSKAWVPVNQ